MASSIDKNDKTRQSGGGARADMFTYNPADLVLITDKKHPLYDERVNLPLSEELVRNIMAYGVLQPISVRIEDGKNDEGEDVKIAVVMAGRQRVRACIEANKRLEARGEMPHKVPAVRSRVDDSKAMGVMVSENEIRRADDVMVKISKAMRLSGMHYSEEDIATTFGVSEATVVRWLKVGEGSPALRAAVSKGLPMDAAVKIADMPHGKQKEAVEKLEADGKIGGHHKGATKAAAALTKGNTNREIKERRSMRSIKQVDAVIADLAREMGMTEDGKLEMDASDKKTLRKLEVWALLKWTAGADPSERQLKKLLGGLFYDLDMTLPEAMKDEK